MFNGHIHHGYRKLTENEATSATMAIEWLTKQRLKPHTIALLTERNLDREGKCLYVRIETKHLIWFRKIHYGGTPLDFYMTEVLPCLKVKTWLFPNQGWTGRNPSFGFHIHAELVENYIQNRRQKLLTLRKRNDTIETSTTKWHIQNKIMVGRRTALRA